MIPKILGTVFFEVFFWYMYVRHISKCKRWQVWVSQTYKHIFTSPSSVEKEPKATRSGNARIHGMTRVTPASIAYATTQVCLKLWVNTNVSHL
jgi:hypothetical protein